MLFILLFFIGLIVIFVRSFKVRNEQLNRMEEKLDRILEHIGSLKEKKE